MKAKKLLSSFVVGAVTLTSFLVAGCGSSKSASSAQAAAANYPKKTIELIVPWSAGGDTDAIMRIVAQGLQKQLGETVVVKNISGGGGTIGAKQAMNAKPDGYTLLAGHDSIALSQLTGKAKFGYSDFEPVSLMTSTYDIVATSAGQPWSSMKDVINDAKSHPGKLTFGATLGSTSEMLPAEIQTAAGIKFNIVGYQGTAERMKGLIGKDIDFGAVSVAAAQNYLKAGKLKLLGIAAPQRDAAVPNVPTLKEQGLNVVEATNRGIFAPKGTPEAIVKKLSDALQKVANSQDFKDKMKSFGTQVNYKNYQDYNSFLTDNQKQMKESLQKSGLLK